MLKTYGKTDVPQMSDLKFNYLIYESYGLKYLTPDSIATFKTMLQNNHDLSLDYLLAKTGYDLSDST